MKAKVFNTKFFFGVLVVFAVVCLFLVFFGVVRAQGHVLSRSNAVTVNDMEIANGLVSKVGVVEVNQPVTGECANYQLIVNAHVITIGVRNPVVAVGNQVINGQQAVVTHEIVGNAEVVGSDLTQVA